MSTIVLNPKSDLGLSDNAPAQGPMPAANNPFPQPAPQMPMPEPAQAQNSTVNLNPQPQADLSGISSINLKPVEPQPLAPQAPMPTANPGPGTLNFVAPGGNEMVLPQVNTEAPNTGSVKLNDVKAEEQNNFTPSQAPQTNGKSTLVVLIAFVLFLISLGAAGYFLYMYFVK